jgi:hypothetical protein
MTGEIGTHELADGRPGHRLVRREDVPFTDLYAGRGSGFESCRLVDGSTGGHRAAGDGRASAQVTGGETRVKDAARMKPTR